MPAPRTPTPEEMFGFGSVPLTSYFGAPEGGSQNTMFSPTARAMLQQGENYQYQQDAIQRQRQAQEEAYQRQKQQQEAERVASQAFGEAPQMTDEQINQQFVQNPAYLQTQQGQNTLGYLKFRQSVTPASDKVLAPQMLKNIEDPRHRAAFQERIQSGVSANDAYEAYRNDTFNEKYALELAAAGVPEEEYDKLRDEKGLIKPDAATRRIRQAKEDIETRKSVADQEISILPKVLSDRIKMLKDMGKTPDMIAADPLIGNYTTRLEAAQTEKLNTLSLKRAAEAAKSPKDYPSETASAALTKTIGKDGAIQTRAKGWSAQAAPAEDLTQAPELRAIAKAQAERQAEAEKTQAAIDKEIASAWTEKKNELQADIEKAYSKKDLLGIASAIDRGDQVPPEMLEPAKRVANELGFSKTVTNELGQSGYPSYENYVLQKLKRAGTAFKEPQNNRWGTQAISQGELLRAWAQQYVRENSGQIAPSGGQYDKEAEGNNEPLTELLPN